jgi:hypothetical protein
MKTAKIEYKTSVLVDAGWRSIYVKAFGTLSASGKTITVDTVIEIDDELVGGYKSRTGSKRQQYNSDYIANRETGAVKRVRNLHSIEIQD